MYAAAGVKTNHNEFPIPDSMKAWVLGDRQLSIGQKPVPVPKKAEVLVRIDAVAICATDLGSLSRPAADSRRPAVQQEPPRPRIYGPVVALGPAPYGIGQRVCPDPRGCGQWHAARACHRLPQLRPHYATSTRAIQRLHHRRRFLRIPGQQHQHVIPIKDDSPTRRARGHHRRHRHVR